MRGKALEHVLATLRKLGGGYFVLRDDDGVQYVVMPKKEFDELNPGKLGEVQLSLPQASPDQPVETRESDQAAQREEANLVLERINREIALYQAKQEEEEMLEEDMLDDIPFQSLGEKDAKKVRFEPLRGDLPPELQE